MLTHSNILNIEGLLNNKKIIYSKLLSDSFNINCVKFQTSDSLNYVVKFYKDKNKKFDAIESEYQNLIFFQKKKINSFPKIVAKNKDYLVTTFIENDNIQPNLTSMDFLNALISLHTITNDKYGFVFDTQIGGLKQKNKLNSSWINFYKNERLFYIYNLICRDNPMDKAINKKIETLLINLENLLPKNPTPRLLHGDMWEGNILFKNKQFVSFIDPGSFYGHKELEIAYLRWFNPSFIDDNFLDMYNDIISVDKRYLEYEPIYQLYYSMLNVYLWNRNYVEDVKNLLNKIKI